MSLKEETKQGPHSLSDHTETNVNSGSDLAETAQQNDAIGTKLEHSFDEDYPLSGADGVIKKPFARPLEIANPPPRPDLTSEQVSKYKALLVRVEQWTEIPVASTKGASNSSLADCERMFLTRD